MKKVKIKIKIIVLFFLVTLFTMSTSVFAQELCTSCECEEESDSTEYSVDIGEEGGEMEFSEAEMLGAELEEGVAESADVAMEVGSEVLEGISTVAETIGGVVAVVGALTIIALQVMEVFVAERLAMIHYDHDVAKIMHGGSYEFPLLPSLHISVEDLNADANSFSGMFYLNKKIGSQDVRTYLKENNAGHHVDKVYKASKFNRHTSYAFSKFKDTIEGPEGIKDNEIIYHYNIPNITLYEENNKLYYRYEASWKHKLDYTWDRTFPDYDIDSDDYTVYYNYKLDTGHKEVIEGEVEIWTAKLLDDGLFVDHTYHSSHAVHVEDAGDKIAIRIKDIDLKGRTKLDPYYLIFRIKKPFQFNGHEYDYVTEFLEDFDPTEKDKRFKLIKTYGDDSDSPGKVYILNQPALRKEDASFYHNTKGEKAYIYQEPLFYIKLIDYQSVDTEASIAKKEATPSISEGINMFPEIYTTPQTQFATGSIVAPDSGKSNLRFDMPNTIGERKDISFIELEVLTHPHIIIVNFQGNVDGGYVVSAVFNTLESKNMPLVFKGLRIENRGTSNEKLHLYDDNTVTFNEGRKDASFVLLNAPLEGGDLVDITTHYTDESFTRKVVRMNAVSNNIVNRGYFFIKESHDFATEQCYLGTNGDNKTVSVLKVTSTSTTKPQWLVEHQADGHYAIMDKVSKKTLGIVDGQVGLYDWEPSNGGLYWQFDFGGDQPKIKNSKQQAYLATPGFAVKSEKTDLVFNFKNGNGFFLERVSNAEPVYVGKKVLLVNRYNNKLLGRDSAKTARLEDKANPTINQAVDLIYTGCLTYAIQTTNTKEFLYNDGGIDLQWHTDNASAFLLNRLEEGDLDLSKINFFTLHSKDKPLFNDTFSPNDLSIDTSESPDLTSYRYHFNLITAEVAQSRDNLALNKPATLSSEYRAGMFSASVAVDGVKTGNWPDFAHSDADINDGVQEYWQVDLGQPADITDIKIYNRVDCCSERTSDYHVFVSESPFTETTVPATQAQLGVLDFHQITEAGRPTMILVHRKGRYVRVQLNSTTAMLNISEVEVFGKFFTYFPHLEGHWSFDKDRGSLVDDSSIHARHGAFRGGASRNLEGKIGGAASLNGSNWIDIPNFNLEKDFTVAAWIKLNNQGDMGALLGPETKNARAADIDLYAYFPRVYGGTSYVAGASKALQVGKWTHLAVTREDYYLTIYVNGRRANKTTWYGNFAIEALGRGREGIGLNGLLDDMYVYSRALSQNEIIRLPGFDETAPFLIGYWKFDETTGTMAHDSSFTGNDGVIHGNPTWIPGKIGGAINLDGFGDWVDIDNITLNKDFTIACWVKFDNKIDHYDAIVGSDSGNGTDIDFFASKPRLYNGRNDVITSNQSINVGVWTHIAITRKEKEVKLYINGKENGEPKNWEFNFIIQAIGRGNHGATTSGLLDELRIYSRALTSTEINALPGLGSSLNISPNKKEEQVADADTFVLYPNPATSEVFLRFNSDVAVNGILRILLLNGDEVLKKSVTIRKGTNQLRVNVSGLSRGIYILNVRGGKMNFNCRFKIEDTVGKY